MRDRLFAAIVKNGCEEYGGNAMCDGNCFNRCEDCITAVNVGKLADALIAEGVIVPPCKVGGTLWIVGEYRGVYSATVRVFFFNEKGVEYIRTTSCDIPSNALGKTVFLTREEAEAALARMKGEGE